MKKILALLLSVLMIVSVLPVSVFAAEVSNANVETQTDTGGYSFEYNGHRYQIFDVSKAWHDARDYCKSLGGHLVTITSQEEQNTVYNAAHNNGSKKSYWLGATDEITEGKFEWVTGEAFSYTCWNSGEPNNQGVEDSLEMLVWANGRWNDGERNGDSGDYSLDNHGFICEWDDTYGNIKSSKAEYSTSDFFSWINSYVPFCEVSSDENDNSHYIYDENGKPIDYNEEHTSKIHYSISSKELWKRLSVSNSLKENKNNTEKWGGSCFGMSMFVALAKRGFFNINNVTFAFPSNVSQIPSPSRSNQTGGTRDWINYIQNSQDSTKYKKYSADISSEKHKDILKTVVERAKKLNETGLDTVFLFGWYNAQTDKEGNYIYDNDGNIVFNSTRHGHAILPIEYYFENKVHVIKCYDPSSGGTCNVLIGKTYSECTITSWCNSKYKKLLDVGYADVDEWADSFSLASVENITKAGVERHNDKNKLYIPSDETFSISDGAKTVFYNNGTFTGNTELIFNCDYTYNGEYSSEMIITLEEGNNYRISAEDNLYCVYESDNLSGYVIGEGSNITANFDSTNENNEHIETSGDLKSYSVSYEIDDESCISVSGNNETKVDIISTGENTVSVSTQTDGIVSTELNTENESITHEVVADKEISVGLTENNIDITNKDELTVTKTYKKLDVSNIDYSSFIEYDGNQHTQNIVVTYGDNTLTEGVDYTLSGDIVATEKGTCQIILTGIGEFKGEISIIYEVGCSHDYTLIESNAATEFEDGYNKYKCSICNDEYTESVTKSCAEYFKLKYDLNGFDGRIDETTCYLDQTMKISDIVPERQGMFAFDSWNTKPDGSGSGYQPGDNITITDSVTLYAIWKEIPQFDYSVISEQNINITKYNGLEKNVEIPSQYDGLTVVGIADSAFENNTDITSVTLCEGVKTIGATAFSGCTSLESISLPSTLEGIGTDAFKDDTALKKVDIPSLTDWLEITFASSVANPTSITKDLYINGELLTELVIPNGITAVNAYAFYNCASITSVDVPSTVKSFGTSAFTSCSNITKVNIPTIEDWLAISFAGSTANPTSQAKSLSINNEITKDLVIPDGTEAIGNYAFYACNNFETVTIPNTVTTIGSNALRGCSGLTEIVIPNSITSISTNLLTGCNNLQKITVPFLGNSKTASSSKSNLGFLFGASSYSQNKTKVPKTLKEVEITGDITTISSNAFYNCDSIEDVYLPAGITKINSRAFYGNTALKNICFAGTEEEWKAITIGSNNTSLNSTNIVYNYTEHEHIAKTVSAVAPSCTDDGLTEGSVCETCGFIVAKQNVIAANGHMWGEYQIVNEDNSIKSKRYCTVCGVPDSEETVIMQYKIDNYNISITNAENISIIRYARGDYSTPSEIKRADGCVTLSGSLISDFVQDGIFTRIMATEGIYTFNVKTVDGVDYVFKADITYFTQELSSTDNNLKVSNLYGVSDIFFCQGHYDTWADVKANHKFRATASKINGAKSYTYAMPGAGEVTVYVKYADTTRAGEFYYTTLTTPQPTITQDGLNITIDDLTNVKCIKRAFGTYTTNAQVKSADGVITYGSNVANGTDTATLHIPHEGELSVMVQYKSGYTTVINVNIEQKRPTFTQDSNKVTIGNLDDLYIVRYAKGTYTKANAVKKASGSVTLRPTAAVDGFITVDNLAKGRYTFFVQYNDESQNIYTITVE